MGSKQIRENKQKILDLTEARKKMKRKKPVKDDFGTSFKIQDRTYSNQIKNYRTKIKNGNNFYSILSDIFHSISNCHLIRYIVMKW
jgi:anthranilate/para-aminobenzoate synthase component I